MKDLLIVHCRSSFLDNDRVYPPLAGLYLKSYLERELRGVSVDVLDDYDLENPEVFEKYKHIGISIMTPQRDEATKILHTIKEKFPEKKVIAGGPHVRFYLNDILKEPFDYLVPMDGERALVNILKGIETRIVYDSLSTIEISLAPRPDRSSREAIGLLMNYNYKLGDRNSTTMMMARGCPNQCTFCEEAGTPVRWSGLDNIIGELDDIKRLGYGGVYIFDDLFAMNTKRVRPIMDAMKERDLIYRCNGHAKYMTPEFAHALADTGCYEIMFGAESGSQKILDNVKKHTTVQQNYDFVKMCKAEGIMVKAFLMLGLPGEDVRSVIETENFIRDSGIDDFQLAIYYPYKGTLIRSALDRGEDIDLIIENEGLGAYGQKGGSTEATVRTKALSSSDLLYMRNTLVDKYRPMSHRGVGK